MEKRSIDKNLDSRKTGRDRTSQKGRNPKTDDSPDKDQNHDESRKNMYDEEVGKALRGSGRAD